MSNCEPLQTRDALVAILSELHVEDHFALLLFDSDIITWKDSLTKATRENVTKAIAYARKIKDNGGMRKTSNNQWFVQFHSNDKKSRLSIYNLQFAGIKKTRYWIDLLDMTGFCL